MKNINGKRPSAKRMAKRRRSKHSNRFIRVINAMINGIRRWFIRRSYAPAICLGAATLIALVIVCVFALPMPKGSIANDAPATAEVVAVRTQSPVNSYVAVQPQDSALYEELKVTNAGDTVSAIIYDKEDNPGNVTVYAAEDAECYHLGDCKFAFASSKRLTAYEAYYLRYRPCGRCNPPVYDPVTGITS